ncbi:MAG: protein TolQ [Zetaproteobacteria bacterium]|nr:protein TolQ [Zetaproteobacteria bacterium]
MSESISIWSLITHAGPVAQFVMLILLSLSLMSWTVMFSKWRAYRQVRKEANLFLQQFWGGSDMDSVLGNIPHYYPNSPLPNIFQAGYREFQRQKQHQERVPEGKIIAGGGIDGIRRSLDAAFSREMEKLSRNLTLLATVGSTAPFIGLFGTVWGIMSAFQNIALTKNVSLAAVAPGIAEALIATAFGLVAAIPAVIAYNKFTSDLKYLAGNMEQFASEFLNILSRHVER